MSLRTYRQREALDSLPARKLDKSAIGVVIALAGMALCVALAYLSALFRHYGPQIREFVHWLVTPQFCIGALCMSAAVALFALLATWSDA